MNEMIHIYVSMPAKFFKLLLIHSYYNMCFYLLIVNYGFTRRERERDNCSNYEIGNRTQVKRIRHATLIS